MIKQSLKITGLLVLFGVIILGAANWSQLKGLWPAISKSPGNIVEIVENNNNPMPGQNTTQFPLKLPDNFKIEIFAKDLPGARVMVFDEIGNMWVSQTSQGKISLLEVSGGAVQKKTEVFRGLDNPHGLTIDPQRLQEGQDLFTTVYFAEEGKISRYIHNHLQGGPAKIADLPTQGGGHFTRTIEFGPDGRLYVSIGSSCNVCSENDPRRAAIYVMDKDGKNFKQFAKGLRNSVFFDWSDVDGSMWATENSRDLLGDDIPPDEINIIQEGGNYGWPTCYGKNLHDSNFDKNTYIRNPCMEPMEKESKVDIQAHSAPLGLDFVPKEGWPEEYWYDLIVALHGSWNRTEPTGYKLIRIKLDEKGNYEGTEDLISGWLTGAGALGRPVDVLIQPGGVMYVSDDKAGVIYKISRI